MSKAKNLDSALKQIKSNFGLCLWPEFKCTEKAIKAHSIQNAQILDLISEDGHLLMPEISLSLKSPPTINFNKVGKNKATTFTGLCSKHDKELFKPLDDHPFNQSDKQQLFLLAYKSVMRELWVKIKTARDIQNQFLHTKNSNSFPNKEAHDYAENKAAIFMIEAYAFNVYKYTFDDIYTKQQYSELKHEILFIDNLLPSIATSSVYQHTKQDYRDFPECISLNIFPNKNGIFIIFSYLDGHSKTIQPYLQTLLATNKHHQLYQVSKLVLQNCENFVLSPTFFNALSESQREKIKDFFVSNMTIDKTNQDDPELYLFKDL